MIAALPPWEFEAAVIERDPFSLYGGGRDGWPSSFFGGGLPLPACTWSPAAASDSGADNSDLGWSGVFAVVLSDSSDSEL